MSDAQSRIKKIIERFAEKDLKEIEKINRPKRKNKSPEKDLVQKPCLEWMRSLGWEVETYEAKATWNGGAWVQQAMKAGTVDCMGNMPNGLGVAIEFKAQDRRHTLRELQREFLLKKINTNVFACVVDSLPYLRDIYGKWAALKQKGDDKGARDFLLSKIPRAKPS